MGTLHSGGEAECAESPHTHTSMHTLGHMSHAHLCQSPQPCTHACCPLAPDIGGRSPWVSTGVEE